MHYPKIVGKMSRTWLDKLSWRKIKIQTTMNSRWIFHVREACLWLKKASVRTHTLFLMEVRKDTRTQYSIQMQMR
jgi:hypothetical protein